MKRMQVYMDPVKPEVGKDYVTIIFLGKKNNNKINKPKSNTGLQT